MLLVFENHHKWFATSSRWTQSVCQERTRSGGWPSAVDIVALSFISALSPLVGGQERLPACKESELFVECGPTCWYSCRTHTTTTTVLYGPFSGTTRVSRCQKRTDFMMQGKINRGRHTDTLAGRHCIQTNQCPPPPSPHIFYRPDAIPAAQPTVSKHWRQLAQSD